MRWTSVSSSTSDRPSLVRLWAAGMEVSARKNHFCALFVFLRSGWREVKASVSAFKPQPITGFKDATGSFFSPPEAG